MRADLHWTVYLKRPASEEQARAETQNLSSEGFYCLSHRPFTAGETVECTIVLAPSGESQEYRKLSGRATVLRVEPASAHLFGIACRLEDYCLNVGPGSASDCMRSHGE